MKSLPYLSRSQQGVILLLGAALLLLWAWRANFLLPPPLPRPGTLNFVFVEVTGAGAHPGVYAFDHAPTLAEIWPKSGAPGTAPASPDKMASGSRVEIAADGHYRLARMHGAELLTLGLPLDLNTRQRRRTWTPCPASARPWRSGSSTIARTTGRLKKSTT